MLRVLILNLFLFSLPFMLYWLWTRLRGKSAADNRTPFLWLLTAGVVLVMIGLASLAHLDAGSTKGSYRPAVMENGRIVPGGIDEPQAGDTEGTTRP